MLIRKTPTALKNAAAHTVPPLMYTKGLPSTKMMRQNYNRNQKSTFSFIFLLFYGLLNCSLRKKVMYPTHTTICKTMQIQKPGWLKPPVML